MCNIVVTQIKITAIKFLETHKKNMVIPNDFDGSPMHFVSCVTMPVVSNYWARCVSCSLLRSKCCVLVLICCWIEFWARVHIDDKYTYIQINILKKKKKNTKQWKKKLCVWLRLRLLWNCSVVCIYSSYNIHHNNNNNNTTVVEK